MAFCWSAAVALLVLFLSVCNQGHTLQLHPQEQHDIDQNGINRNKNNHNLAANNLDATENEGFLAQLHRRLTQASDRSRTNKDNNNKIYSLNHQQNEQSNANLDQILQQLKQRQQQLQKLQNYFGPEVAEDIEQLQQEQATQQQRSSFNPLRTAVDFPAESVAHVAFSPETRINQKFEHDNVDALRKYHLLSSSMNEGDSQFASRPQTVQTQEIPEEWEKILQQLATERQANGGEDIGETSSIDDQRLAKIEQLMAMQPKQSLLQQAAEEELGQEQMASLIRNAPLEAILAQAKSLADTNRFQRELSPYDSIKSSPVAYSSKSELFPSGVPLTFSQNAQAAMTEQKGKTNQLIMKKQSNSFNKLSPANETPSASVAAIVAYVDKPTKEDSSQNFSTQLKKVEISSQNGRQLRKEESYERSVQLSPSGKLISSEQHSRLNNANDQLKEATADNKLNGEHQLLLTPAEAHLERSTLNQVQQPIAVHLRNAPDSATPLTQTLTGRLSTFGDLYFLLLVIGCSTASILSIIGAGVCFYRFQQHHKTTADVDYPAYGVIGPLSKPPISPGAQQPLQTESKSRSDSKKSVFSNSENAASGQSIARLTGEGTTLQDNESAPSGDRKLAQSAQMYHYQHQKQQMIASEKANAGRNTSTSDVESDEENEEGDYTVYECPGLASTGEIEVTNPLFQHSP